MKSQIEAKLSLAFLHYYTLIINLLPAVQYQKNTPHFKSTTLDITKLFFASMLMHVCAIINKNKHKHPMTRDKNKNKMKNLFIKLTKITCSLLLATNSLSIAAQPTWSHIDNKDGSPVGVAYDSFGNAYYASTAKQSPTSTYDIRIMKYSKTGTLLNTVYYDYQNGTDYPTKIKIDTNNNIYVIGVGKSFAYASPLNDVLLLKYNTSLQLQWANHKNFYFRNNEAVDLTFANGGRVYVLINFNVALSGPSNYDIGLYTVKADGTDAFADIYSDNNSGKNQKGMAIKTTSNGSYLTICGTNETTSFGYDALLITYLTSFAFAKITLFHTVNDTSYDCFNDFQYTNNSEIIAWGESQTKLNNNSILTRPMIAKYDFIGTYFWNNSLTNTTSETAIKMFIDGSQNAIGITGKGRFVKFSGATGALLKDKPKTGMPVSINDAGINNKGQVYICGSQAHTNIYGGDSTESYLAKLSNGGALSWESKWMAPAFTTDEHNFYRGLSISKDRVYVIGAHYGTGYDVVMQCFKPSGLLRLTNDDSESDNETFAATDKISSDADDNQFSITLYPNPANNFISVKTNSTFEQCYITDVTGKVVKNVAANEGNYIDLSEIKSGIYLIKVVAQNETIVKKFIKQ